MIQLATVGDAQPGDELHHPIAPSPRRILQVLEADNDTIVSVPSPDGTYHVTRPASAWEATGWTAHTHGGQGDLFAQAGRA